MYLSNLPSQHSKHCKDYAVKEEQEAIASGNDIEMKYKFLFLKRWLQEAAKKIKVFCLFLLMLFSLQ